jgi:hypothetical protein
MQSPLALGCEPEKRPTAGTQRAGDIDERLRSVDPRAVAGPCGRSDRLRTERIGATDRPDPDTQRRRRTDERPDVARVRHSVEDEERTVGGWRRGEVRSPNDSEDAGRCGLIGEPRHDADVDPRHAPGACPLHRKAVVLRCVEQLDDLASGERLAADA